MSKRVNNKKSNPRRYIKHRHPTKRVTGMMTVAETKAHYRRLRKLAQKRKRA